MKIVERAAKAAQGSTLASGRTTASLKSATLFWGAGATALYLLTLAGHAVAADASVENLDQRIRILERQLEIQKEDADTKAKDAPVTTIGDKGVSIKSAKGDYEFKFRGLMQLDTRVYLDDFNPTGIALTPTTNRDSLYTNDTAFLRRIEPIFEFTAGKIAYIYIKPNFAPSNSAARNSADTGTINVEAAQFSDYYGELRLNPAVNFRIGRFKEPVGLEQLQSSSALTFIERGFVNELAPNRDIGIQVAGDVLGSTLNYAFAWFNGAPDGRDGAFQDQDNRKELVGRLFAEPFKNSPGFLQGLGIGIGGTVGPKRGSGTYFVPAGYRSPGQQTIFSYIGSAASVVIPDGTDADTLPDTTTAVTGVAAVGDQTRISPQFYYYRNSFGLLGEYITSKQELARGTTQATLENSAWQAVASYVVTGEDASYRGVVKPNQSFKWGGEGWGALEIALRYGVLDIDDDAFAGTSTTRFANPATAVSEAKTYGIGTNWYLNSNLKLLLNYSDTSFEGGAVSGDRKDEKTVFGRFQVSF